MNNNDLQKIASRVHLMNSMVKLNCVRDGNAYCVTLPDFLNLQESKSVFVSEDIEPEAFYAMSQAIGYNRHFSQYLSVEVCERLFGELVKGLKWE